MMARVDAMPDLLRDSFRGVHSEGFIGEASFGGIFLKGFSQW